MKLFARKRRDPSRVYLLIPTKVAGHELHKRLGTEESVVVRTARPNDIREGPFAPAVIGCPFGFTPAPRSPYTWANGDDVHLEIIPRGYGFTVTLTGGSTDDDGVILTHLQQWIIRRDPMCAVRSIRGGDHEVHIVHAPHRGTSDWNLTVPIAHLDENPYGFRRDATAEDALWIADDGGHFTCTADVPGIVCEFSHLSSAMVTNILHYLQQGMGAQTAVD